MPYAERTTVSVSKSKSDIETILKKSGASQFAYATAPEGAVIAFRISGRNIQMRLPMAKPTKSPTKDDQEERRRWRALYLVVKAKLEAIASGIATLEDEFLAYTVMATGQTVGGWAAPQIQRMVETGQMPSLMPGLDPRALPASDR